jgi:NAD(P)H-dependent FMN reductase
MNNKRIIGVIAGASREGRLSEVPAQWIYSLAAQRADLQFELIDIGDHPLPFFQASTRRAAPRLPRAGIAQRWRTAFERLDGFIVVVAQDELGSLGDGLCEATALSDVFTHKPVGFVGFGRHDSKAHVDTLRSLASDLRMTPMSRVVHLTISEALSVWQMSKGFDDYPHLIRAANDLLDELASWTHALTPASHASIRAGARSAGRALSWPRQPCFSAPQPPR